MKIIEQKMQWGVNINAGFNCFTVRRRDFVAQGIRWFSHWDSLPKLPCPSHTFIATGPNLTVEAFGDGVHEGTLLSYLNDPDIALLVRRPRFWSPAMGEAMVCAANTYIGKRYGYWLIAGMALSQSVAGHAIDSLTSGWFGRKVDALFDSRSTQICSKLVAEVDEAQPELRDLGVLKQPAYHIKPVDLFFDDAIFEPGAIELVN